MRTTMPNLERCLKFLDASATMAHKASLKARRLEDKMEFQILHKNVREARRLLLRGYHTYEDALSGRETAPPVMSVPQPIAATSPGGTE